MSVIVYQFQTVKFIQMMSLTFGLFTQVSGSGPLGPLVSLCKMIGNTEVYSYTLNYLTLNNYSIYFNNDRLHNLFSQISLEMFCVRIMRKLL